MTAKAKAGLPISVPKGRIARIRRISQIVLAAIWLIDGALQLQPVMFGKPFVTGVILPNASGQPGAVGSSITWIAQHIEPHVALFNGCAVALQVLIGLALMWGRMVRPALVVSFAWAAAIWFAGEGCGGILNGKASPLTGAPGAALLYIVVGVMVWPREGEGERARRFAWIAVWLTSAVLWVLPANDGAGSLHDAIASAPSGAGWLTDVLRVAANATTGDGTAVALIMAALSAAIAFSGLTRTADRAFVGLGIALSVVFWIAGQGLGGILTGSGTDVSTAPLVPLMGWMLLAGTGFSRSGAPRRLTGQRYHLTAPG